MNATPEFKVVGSNCLADFLGHANPEDVAKLFEYLADAVSSGEEFEGGGFGGNITHIGLVEFLGYVAAVIRNDGWLSRGAARQMDNVSATVDTAWGVLMAVLQNKTRDIDPKYFPTEDDHNKAKAAKEFMVTFIEGEKAKGELNDYLYNLDLVCRMNVIDRKTCGLAASILPTAAREQGREIERMKFSNLKATSKYFAEVGEKVVVKATLMGSREMEGNFGCTTMMRFVTVDGNACTWFASGSFPEGEWVIGNEYILAGTVKKTEDYKGMKQTMLTRVTAVTQEWVDAEKVKAEKKAARAAKKAAKLAAVDSKVSP